MSNEEKDAQTGKALLEYIDARSDLFLAEETVKDAVRSFLRGGDSMHPQLIGGAVVGSSVIEDPEIIRLVKRREQAYTRVYLATRILVQLGLGNVIEPRCVGVYSDPPGIQKLGLSTRNASVF